MSNNQINMPNLNILDQSDSMSAIEKKTSKNAIISNADFSLNDDNAIITLNSEIDELLEEGKKYTKTISSKDEIYNFDELLAEVDRALIPTKKILLEAKNAKQTFSFGIKNTKANTSIKTNINDNDIG